MQHQKEKKKNYVIDYFSFEAFIFQHNFSDFKKHQLPTSFYFLCPVLTHVVTYHMEKNIWFTTVWEISEKFAFGLLI